MTSDPTTSGALPDVLRQPRDGGRVIAGVCGAAARRWNVDPLLVRVAAVLLLLSNGVGAVLYATGWLFMPAQPGERSIAERVVPGITGWNRRTFTIVVVVACAVVALSIGQSLPFGLVPVVVLAVVWFLASRNRRPEQSAPEAAAPGAWSLADTGSRTASGNAAPTDFDLAVQRWQQRLEQVERSSDSSLPPPAPAVPVTAVASLTTAARTAAPRRRRSWGAGLALSGIVCGVFLTSLALGVGAEPGVSPLLLPASLALAVVALGLLVGAWTTRPRLAVLVGIVLSGVVAFTALVPLDPAHPTYEQTTWTAQSSVPSGPVAIAGRVVEIDASGLALTQDASVTYSVRGASLRIALPANLPVTVVYDVQGGYISVPEGPSFGGTTSGTWSRDGTGPRLRLHVILRGASVVLS